MALFSNLRPLSPYLRKYRKTFSIGAVCVLFNNGIWILFPLVIRKAVDDLNREVTTSKLLTYAGMLLASSCGQGHFSVPHPLDPDRGFARNRVRPSQRPV